MIELVRGQRARRRSDGLTGTVTRWIGNRVEVWSSPGVDLPTMFAMPWTADPVELEVLQDQGDERGILETAP